MSQSKTCNLQVTFKGAALEDHLIDVKAFASSLLALSEVIQSAYSISFGEEAQCQFKLKATKPNCVTFEFILSCIAIGSAASYVLFKTDWETDVNQFLKNLGFLKTKGLSLISFFRKLGKRKIIKTEPVESDGSLCHQLTLDDDTKLMCSHELYKLIVSPYIRENQYKIFKPLENKGFQSISYSAKKQDSWVVANKVTHEEVDLFKPDIIDELPKVEEFFITGRLDRPSLIGECNGWKIRDENSDKSITFSITDPNFLQKVRGNEISFVGSDIFRVHMRSITPPPSENKKTRYEGFEIELLSVKQKNLF